MHWSWLDPVQIMWMDFILRINRAATLSWLMTPYTLAFWTWTLLHRPVYYHSDISIFSILHVVFLNPDIYEQINELMYHIKPYRYKGTAWLCNLAWLPCMYPLVLVQINNIYACAILIVPWYCGLKFNKEKKSAIYTIEYDLIPRAYPEGLIRCTSRGWYKSAIPCSYLGSDAVYTYSGIVWLNPRLQGQSGIIIA